MGTAKEHTENRPPFLIYGIKPEMVDGKAILDTKMMAVPSAANRKSRTILALYTPIDPILLERCRYHI